MIYFFYGTDFVKTREKAHIFMDSLLKKKPDASVFTMSPETYSDVSLKEYSSARGLFEEKHIVFLDHISGSSEGKDGVLSYIGEMASSPNIFVILESAIDKKIAQRIEKKSQKTQIYSKESEVKEKKFNIFSLTDAVGARNKKNTWILFNKALLAGLSPEEIHGVLVWQVKSMLVASSAGTPKDAGMSSFVFKKSFNFAKNFSKLELKEISSRLASMYHENRRGGSDISSSLEELMLEL